MGIGLSGLTSGMDTDAIVEAMVMEKTERKNKLVKAQTKLEWKQDAWKTLNSKIYSFYTKSLSNMRLAGSYSKSKVSVSNPTVASVVAQNSSINGTQTLGIQQLAKAGYLTGGRITKTDGSRVSSDTKLSELGIGDASFNVTIGGKETIVDITGDTTMGELVSKLRSTGANANFDATNQRFYVSAKDSGVENDFSFTAASGAGLDALKALGLYAGATKADLTQYKKWAAYATDTDAFNALVESAQKAAHTTLADEVALWQKEVEDLGNKNKSLAEENKKHQTTLYQKAYADECYAGGEMDTDKIDAYKEKWTTIAEDLKAKDAETLTDDEKAQLEEAQARLAAADAVDVKIGNATYVASDREEYLKKLDEDAGKAQKAIDDNKAAIADNEALITEKQAALDDEDKTAITASYEKKNTDSDAAIKKAYENKRDAAVAYMNNYNLQAKYNAGDPSVTAEQYQASVNAIGNIKGSSAGDGTGAVRIEGQDAIIYLNGAKYEGASNTFSINGLTITAQELTGGSMEEGNLQTVSVTTSTDSQGIYDMVKEFLKGYNELINEMDKLYNADSARGYEPLTSEEKEEMTDGDIELWEKKVKDSLLRRDSSLNNIISVMKNSMSGGVNIDGKQYYLSEFGIQTAGYLYAAENERGAYYIDGDEDGINASKTDKLLAAILQDPEHVTEVISGIAGNLYQNMTTAMRSTTLSSTYTVYNDKQMKTEYNKYKEQIADAEEDITWWEDYYRSKFTTMETMLASLNQQQSSLSGLFSSY